VAEEDADLDALAVPSTVRLAGGVLIGAGVAVGITGLQILMFFVVRGPYQAVAPLSILLAGGCVFFGWGVVRARAVAAKAGVVTGAGTCLFALGWAALALVNGTLSLIAVAVVPLSGLATLLVFRALPTIRSIDQARERLRAQGLDMGA
jgi:hypothetical protein